MAYAEAYEHHAHEVVTFAYGYIGDWDKAQDFAAEAWENAYKAWEKFHARPNPNLLGWMRTIVHNLVMNSFRKKHNPDDVALLLNITDFVDAPDHDGVEYGRLKLSYEVDIDLILAKVDPQSEYYEALRQLPPNHRNTLIIKIKYEDDKDAARALGVSYRAYRVRLHRARQAILGLLSNKECTA